MHDRLGIGGAVSLDVRVVEWIQLGIRNRRTGFKFHSGSLHSFIRKYRWRMYEFTPSPRVMGKSVGNVLVTYYYI